VLEKGIETAPDPLDLIYMLARMYRQKGDKQKADELMERATQKQLTTRGRSSCCRATRAARAISTARSRPRTRRSSSREGRERTAAQGRGAARARLPRLDAERLAEGRKLVEAVLANEPSNPAACS